MRVCFGEFVFDSDARELRRGRQTLALSPKAFQLLEALVESRPRALSKTSLYGRLWPNTFVVERNLANLVSEIRGALADDPRRPRFIRTVQRYGYAFLEEPVVQAPQRPQRTGAAPVFRLLWSGGRATLHEGEHVLGRDPGLDLCFTSPTVSRRHARLVVNASEAVLEDLGSKNGTYLNGQRIAATVRLSDRDEIRIGNPVRLTFRRTEPAASTATARARRTGRARGVRVPVDEDARGTEGPEDRRSPPDSP